MTHSLSHPFDEQDARAAARTAAALQAGSEDALRDAYVNIAEKERAYRVALARRITELHADGVAFAEQRAPAARVPNADVQATGGDANVGPFGPSVGHAARLPPKTGMSAGCSGSAPCDRSRRELHSMRRPRSLRFAA